MCVDAHVCMYVCMYVDAYVCMYVYYIRRIKLADAYIVTRKQNYTHVEYMRTIYVYYIVTPTYNIRRIKFADAYIVTPKQNESFVQRDYIVES